MYNKPIIVFEGIEASGKTTHINYVASYLKRKNPESYGKVLKQLNLRK